MKVALVGYAVENQAALRFFQKQGADVTVCDQNPDVEVPDGVAARLGNAYLEGLDEFDVVVRTVGMHPRIILEKYPGLKDKLTTAVNIFFENCETPIIGVTGTKGKGTTSTLITRILEAAGKKVVLAGNIGVPMLDQLDAAALADYVVLELSSFQLIDCRYSPHIGVCLLVEPEHLDWHKDTAEYFDAKRQLFAHQEQNDVAIYYAPNENSVQIAGASAGQKIPYYRSPGAVVEHGAIEIGGQQICSTSEIKLLGRHNWQNVCAAVTATWQITQDIGAMRRAITSFGGLPFRIELRREVDGVRYYNDSFATQPAATMAAFDAITGPKVMILGGHDRGLDLSRLAQHLQAQPDSIRKLVLIGVSAQRLSEALTAAGCTNFVLSKATTMPEIVAEAKAFAQPGDAVVLSPGFASFDMFKNFEDRGRQFNAAVQALSQYDQFIFERYEFDKTAGILTLRYSLDGKRHFTEIYRFDFPFVDYDEAALDRAIQALFFMAGTSYYKTFIPPKITIDAGELDGVSAQFFSKTYQRGLGEFFYVNQLDPRTAVNFPVNSDKLSPVEAKRSDGLLVGIGGGKDSLVTIEALRDQPRVATWSLNHRPQLTPLIETIGLTHFWVERELDPQLLELRDEPSAYNGHVPISAIFACVGTIVSVLGGYRDNIVSNESTASEPTLTYQGVAINHQYSKSLEFEQDFQTWLRHHFGDSLRYYSFLRPFTELYIAELFAQRNLEKYRAVFSSCNRAFVHESSEMSWCGQCPKCAFVFLALTPFVPRTKLESLWGGKNLLLDPKLEPTYRALLGIEGDKPLDCVGEVKESRAAMRLAQDIYPELKKYEFDLPADYNYRERRAHLIPPEIAELLPSQD